MKNKIIFIFSGLLALLVVVVSYLCLYLFFECSEKYKTGIDMKQGRLEYILYTKILEIFPKK